MNQYTKRIFVIVGILILLAGGGYLIYRDMYKSDEKSDGAGYTVESISSGEITTGSTDISVSVDMQTQAPIQDLDRFIVNDKTIPADAVAAIEKNIHTISASLKKDPNQLDLWLDLGIHRKTLGDYEGARDAWVYATAMRPSGSVAFHNLGDLYGYYLHDNEKAEANFLKAIKNGPNDIYLYFNTAAFYRDVMNDMTKARAIVEQGISANPDSADLKSLMESFQ